MLHQLIRDLCPNGVEYKTLGEIKTDIYRGAGIKRDELTEVGTPCIRYGEIYTTYGIWFDSCVSFTDETQIKSKKYMEHGDILFAITGESVEEIAKSTAYMGYERCLVGGDIVVMKHNQNPKYLSYALSTQQAQKQKSKGKVKGKVVHSNVPSIESIRLPIPPLEVQEEIVRILDEYSEKKAQLIDALKAELEARKVQYEYYRGQIFANKCLGIEPSIIKDVCIKTCSGGTPKTSHSSYYGGDIPWLRTQEVDWEDIYDTEIKITDEGLKNSSAKLIPENCVIVAMYGATAAKSAINKIPLTTNQACCNLQIDPKKARYRYVYYWLCHEYLKLKSLGRGSQDNLNADMIKNYPIVVPALDIQDDIIATLDKYASIEVEYEKSIQDEIQLRQTQYEYYRDKLLSFREAN